MATDKVQFVPLSKIKVSNRTRVDMGDLEGLIESIRDKGVIQPITISTDFHLQAGGRRYAAAKEAGLKEIPCLIRTVEKNQDVDALEVELIENIFRQDFTFAERALHTKKLHDLCTAKNIDWSGRKLAKLLNRDTMSVARDLQIANALEILPELSKAKDQNDALRTIKRMQEKVVVEELRKRQDVQMEKKTDTGAFLERARSNYRIGDCFTGMAELRSNGMVHFIELDPPYAIDLGQTKKGDAPKNKSYNEVPVKAYQEFMTRMATETYRVAASHAWMICWFGPTHFHLVKSALEKAKWQVNDVPAIWIKPTGQTMAPEFNLANCYEPFFVCRKGSPTLVKRGRSNVFDFNPEPAANKYHPTQRPLSLISEIMETFCLPRQVCLVPCLGSGTTLRAAYLRGMPAFGWDLSSEYLDRFLLAAEEDLRQLNREGGDE